MSHYCPYCGAHEFEAGESDEEPTLLELQNIAAWVKIKLAEREAQNVK